MCGTLVTDKDAQLIPWGAVGGEGCGLDHGPRPERLGGPNEFGSCALSVAARTSHAAAVMADGGLWTWGDGDSGQLGHGDIKAHVERRRGRQNSCRLGLGRFRRTTDECDSNVEVAHLPKNRDLCPTGKSAGTQVHQKRSTYRGKTAVSQRLRRVVQKALPMAMGQTPMKPQLGDESPRQPRSRASLATAMTTSCLATTNRLAS